MSISSNIKEGITSLLTENDFETLLNGHVGIGYTWGAIEKHSASHGRALISPLEVYRPKTKIYDDSSLKIHVYRLKFQGAESSPIKTSITSIQNTVLSYFGDGGDKLYAAIPDTSGFLGKSFKTELELLSSNTPDSNERSKHRLSIELDYKLMVTIWESEIA